MELSVPQLRATEGRFGPQLVERLGTRSVDLEGLVWGMLNADFEAWPSGT